MALTLPENLRACTLVHLEATTGVSFGFGRRDGNTAFTAAKVSVLNTSRFSGMKHALIAYKAERMSLTLCYTNASHTNSTQIYLFIQ